MKRILKIVAMAVLVAVALCSCAKEGPGRFKGNYSFKTSGTVSVREKGNGNAEISKVKLSDEQGQMNILKEDGDAMIVTMNVLSGAVVVFDAEASGKEIRLQPVERVLSITHGLSSSINLNAVVSGVGHRYDDTVIFELVYTGDYESFGVEYEIVGSDVKCVARLN